MPTYTCEPGLELNGQTARSLLENLNQDLMRPFLDAHGLDEVDPDAWYPLQDVLNVMNDIEAAGNATGSFVAIGVKAAELSPLPPEMEAMGFEQFMLIYADVYQQRHRNGYPGELVIESIDSNHILIHFNVPYPDDVMYGLIFGYARRLMSARGFFTVYYDEDVPTREQGGDETLIHATWEV